MSDTDVRDLHAAHERAAARLVEVGLCSTVPRAVTLRERLASSGEACEFDADGTLYGRRRDSIGGALRTFTVDRLAALITDGRMLAPGEPPLTADELAEAHAAAVTAVPRSPAPARTYPPQMLPHAAAPRFLGRFEVRTDRDDVLRWRSRRGDPVRGGGSPPPPPELTQRAARPTLVERWRRRNDPVGDPVTPAVLEAAALSSGLLAQGERPDWAEVVTELRALVGP